MSKRTDVHERMRVEEDRIVEGDRIQLMNKAAFTLQFYMKRAVRRFRARQQKLAESSQQGLTDGGGPPVKRMTNMNRSMERDRPLQPHPDQIPIRVKNLSFFYHGETVFENVNFEVDQGVLAAVTGKRSQGKYTLLQILGQVQVPPKGMCFIPSHLRVLHIAPTLYFLEGSVRYNLFFGIIDHYSQLENLDPEIVDRAYRILQKLSLPAHIFAAVRGEVEINIAALPRSDRALLSLARALIANPEVLVLHTPGIFFGAVRRDLVMHVLQEYVDQRGLCLDPLTRLRRRPRTCIFSSSDFIDLKYADKILECKNKGVVEVSLEDVKAQLQRIDYFRI
jgi:ATPase subunit of ABC transporter with duplicated ATPase domains